MLQFVCPYEINLDTMVIWNNCHQEYDDLISRKHYELVIFVSFSFYLKKLGKRACKCLKYFYVKALQHFQFPSASLKSMNLLTIKIWPYFMVLPSNSLNNSTWRCAQASPRTSQAVISWKVDAKEPLFLQN